MDQVEREQQDDLMSDAQQSQPEIPQRPQRVGWLRRQFADILYVARRDKKWWLLPLLFLILILATLAVVASTAGPLAPFIYPFL